MKNNAKERAGELNIAGCATAEELGRRLRAILPGALGRQAESLLKNRAAVETLVRRATGRNDISLEHLYGGERKRRKRK